MAAPTVESPIQHTQYVDLRSEAQDWKRDKNASAKWSYGTTVSAPMWPMADDSSDFRARPLGKPHKGHIPKDVGNINKTGRTTGRIKEIGNKRVRSKVSAQEEIDEAASVTRSVLDYLPGLNRQNSHTMDHVFYSFDRQESPGRPLTLEVFVKSTGRETERFVEKEYEVIDGNGDALKGRKARRNLRQGVAKSGEEECIEDEGFELL